MFPRRAQGTRTPAQCPAGPSCGYGPHTGSTGARMHGSHSPSLQSGCCRNSTESLASPPRPGPTARGPAGLAPARREVPMRRSRQGVPRHAQVPRNCPRFVGGGYRTVQEGRIPWSPHMAARMVPPGARQVPCPRSPGRTHGHALRGRSQAGFRGMR